MFDFFRKKPQNGGEQSNEGHELSFEKLKSVISNTARALTGGLNFAENEEYSEVLTDEIEENLIKADIGLETAVEITDKIREKQLKASEIGNFLKEEFRSILKNAPSPQINFSDGDLNIYLITGVNGAGKTTLIAKTAYMFKSEGKKVLVAAADTFRAAAEEQLNIWSDRAGADIVRKDGADAASVVFDAIEKAKSEKYDVLLIDTAGRLQNKFNLMEELKKIKSVINKKAPENLKESFLVLDANTGQNGLIQAEVFKDAADVTAVALTKLDGSAKGGIIFAIAEKYNLPVKLVGTGEKMTDLKIFDADNFVNAIFE